MIAPRRLLICVVLGMSAASAARAGEGGVELIGVAKISGSARDKSGLGGLYTNAKGESIPANLAGSYGSSISYTGKGELYYCPNDRGFGDGSTASVCRLQIVELKVDARAKRVGAKLVETRLLTDEQGRNFNGLAANFIGSDPNKNYRFDPEGVRVGKDGSLFVSDEYGPSIWQFDASGKRVKTLRVPSKFLIAELSADEKVETARNTSGRVTNKGMEALAITPDGKMLLGAMQSPLIQDGGRQGTNVRLLALEIATGATREYVYALPKHGLGLSEILAIDADRFIVLERDGKGGSEAKHKRLVKIDLRGATDVSDVGNKLHTGLPLAGLPEGVKAVARTEWLDLLDPRFGLAGASFPEKVEGVAWGPDLADGRKLLVVSCDNDLNPRQDVVFWAFAVDKSELE